VPKGPQGQKRKAPKGAKRPAAKVIFRWEKGKGASKKLPRNLPEDPIARGVAIMREATGQAKTDQKAKN
jgi:hypothetical protein